MKIAGRDCIFSPLSIIMAANKKGKSINHLSVTSININITRLRISIESLINF